MSGGAVNRPTGQQLAARLRAARSEGYRHAWPAPTATTDAPARETPIQVTIPAGLRGRVERRARLLGVRPAVLVRALVRHYLEHPDYYTVESSGGGVVVARQRPLFDVEG